MNQHHLADFPRSLMYNVHMVNDLGNPLGGAGLFNLINIKVKKVQKLNFEDTILGL